MMLRYEDREIGLPYERLHVMGYRRRPLNARGVVLARMTARSRRADAAALFRRIKLGPAGPGTEDPARGR